MRPLAILLLLIATAASAAERQLATPPAGPAFGAQQPAAIAFAGNSGFVVWTDWRGGSTPAIYGSRIELTGSLLDPEGIRINPGREGAIAHGVVAARSGWVAVWSEGTAVYARRIAPDGSLDGAPVRLLDSASGNVDVAAARGTIAVATSSQVAIASDDLILLRSVDTPLAPVALVSDGTDYVVFGYTPTPGHPARAVRVRINGDVGSLAPASIIGTLHAVAWTGHDFLVHADGYFFRVSQDLNTVGPPISVFSSGRLQAMTGGAGHTAIVWTENDSVQIAAIGDQRADAAVRLGNLRDYSPLVAAPTQFGYMVASEGLRVALVPFDLILPAPDPLNGLAEQTRSVSAQSHLAAVRDGSSDLFAYIESDGNGSHVMIGSPRFPPFPLLDTAVDQFAPSIASNGTHSLVTWIERDPTLGNPRVMGLIVDNHGRSTLFGPLPLGATDFSAGDVWSGRDTRVWPAAVVWNGSMFFVAWNGRLARVTPNGTVLDTPAKSLLPPTFLHRDRMAMARFGNDVLIAWMEGDWFRGCASPCSSRVRAARLDANGDVIDPVETLSDTLAVLPDVAASGDSALVVWEEAGAIRMARVNTTGDVTRLQAGSGMRPSVARHSTGFVVAWDTPSGSVQAVNVSPSLAISPAVTITREATPAHGPHAWTAPTGIAQIGYARFGLVTEWVPRLYATDFFGSTPARRRAVRR